MRRAITIVAIFFVACVVGAIVTPPDLYTYYLATGLLTLWGISCYALGLREGRAALHGGQKQELATSVSNPDR
jgi:Sec-independent protein secretion pathway component TatC